MKIEKKAYVIPKSVMVATCSVFILLSHSLHNIPGGGAQLSKEYSFQDEDDDEWLTDEEDSL